MSISIIYFKVSRQIYYLMLIRTSAEIYLEEADEFLNKGDLVDACEKYYKAAREAIILLAYKYNIHGDNIEDIVTKLAEILGDNIISYWAGASLLYTARKELDAELIKMYRQDVVELVNLANEKFNS
ncbi:PaREP1 family protein [Sulfolobaceae archaeon RB850M]